MEVKIDYCELQFKGSGMLFCNLSVRRRWRHLVAERLTRVKPKAPLGRSLHRHAAVHSKGAV
jgi:hypothetical protein